MSDLFGAGSEDLDWTSDLGVSKPFTFNLLACLKTRFSTCRPLSKVKIMLEVLIKLKLYVYKNDSNVNFFYFRYVSRPVDERFTDSGRSRPLDKVGTRSSRLGDKGGGEGGWVGLLWSKNKGGRAPLLDPAPIENVQSTK